jgi:hypothetical protein
MPGYMADVRRYIVVLQKLFTRGQSSRSTVRPTIVKSLISTGNRFDVLQTVGDTESLPSSNGEVLVSRSRGESIAPDTVMQRGTASHTSQRLVTQQGASNTRDQRVSPPLFAAGVVSQKSELRQASYRGDAICVMHNAEFGKSQKSTGKASLHSALIHGHQSERYASTKITMHVPNLMLSAAA